MIPKFTRCPENPIVRPGLFPWRMCTVFNPGVLYDDGKFFLYERAAGNLRPFRCDIGLLESGDGVHFTRVCRGTPFIPSGPLRYYDFMAMACSQPKPIVVNDTVYLIRFICTTRP